MTSENDGPKFTGLVGAFEKLLGGQPVTKKQKSYLVAFLILSVTACCALYIWKSSSHKDEPKQSSIGVNANNHGPDGIVVSPLQSGNGSQTIIVTPHSGMSQKAEGKRIDALELTALTIDRYAWEPLLDFQIRNPMDEVVLITSATINIDRVRQIPAPTLEDGGPLRPSENYWFKVDLENFPNEITVPLSQQLGPNDVDRFRLSLRASPKPPPDGVPCCASFVIECRISLQYNKSSHVECGKVVILKEIDGSRGYGGGVDTPGYGYKGEELYMMRHVVLTSIEGANVVDPRLEKMKMLIDQAPPTPGTWKPPPSLPNYVRPAR